MSDETPDPTPEGDGTEALVVDLSAPLPDFEGLTPVGVLTSLTGAGQRIVRPLHLDEKVVLVVEARVANVAHPMTSEGMKRSHTLKVEDLYELPGLVGPRLMAGCRKAWRLADDARHGRTALDGLGTEGDGIEVTTDGTGVVLTPADRAALGLDDRGSDAVVVIFADGARALWPDDWGRHPIERPAAGESVVVPGGGDDLVLVRQLLDPATGDVVDEFTEADAEAAELAQAAVEDRAAAYELERGRMENRAPFDGYDEAEADAADLPPLPEEGVGPMGWDVVSATGSVIWSDLPTREEAEKEADRLNAGDRKTGKPFRVEEVEA